ncbi:uncharacterized protein LOC136079943 [Hydra vulgaris]|uniref:Uncharacterized protein LOC136079943 n=1 Tax=Hydra vulgaris TaxID=6087 RepID=A0ABM4BU41_HYDVU
MNHWVGLIFHKVMEYIDQQNPYINGVQLNELVMVVQEKYPEFRAIQYSKCFHERIINRFKNYRRKMNCASVIENRKKYAKAAMTKAIKRAVSDSDISQPLRLKSNTNEVLEVANEAYLVTVSNNVQTSLEAEVLMETTFMQRNNARETVGFSTELELFKSYFLSAENVYNESKRMLQVYELNKNSPYKDNGLGFEGVQVLLKDSLRNICLKWGPFLKRYLSLLNLVKMVNPTMASSESNLIGFQFIVARCRQKMGRIY